MTKLTKLHREILAILQEKPLLTLDEISENVDKPKKKLFKALRKLLQNDLVETHNRKYCLTKEGETEND